MGRAFLRVDPKPLAEALGVSEDSCYDLASALLVSVQKALLLPASYRVVALDFDRQYYTYRVYVEGEHLPEVADGNLTPQITPTYHRAAPDWKPQLTAIYHSGESLPLN